jgi:hypothetical protein
MNWVTSVSLTLISLLPAAAFGQRVVVTGLQGPQKLVMTAKGNFLVTETSKDANSGRVSFVSRDGTRRSLFEAMPSGTDPTGGGSGPTAMAINGQTLYLAIGGGDAERHGEKPGTSMHNPDGISSPIFDSVLKVQFSTDIDLIGGTFTMTPDAQQKLADGDSVSLEDGSGSKAQIQMLARVPTSSPDPVTIYRFSNPWALEFSPAKDTLYLGDGSKNALFAIDLASGRLSKVLNFPNVPNHGPLGPPVVEAVPTSIRAYGDSLLVSFLTGAPFSQYNGRVLIVDPANRTAAPFIANLTTATDVVFMDRPGQSAEFFVSEHSMNLISPTPVPGRILRYRTNSAEVLTDQVIKPTSMVIDSANGYLYVLQLIGSIVEFKI